MIIVRVRTVGGGGVRVGRIGGGRFGCGWEGGSVGIDSSDLRLWGRHERGRAVSEPKMWIGLHTGPPKIEYDDYGLRQRTTDAFARVDVDEDGRGTWSAPAVESTPVRIILADGSWADHTFAGGGPGSVTHSGVFDAPTGGSMRDLRPTGETVVDDEGVTRQVWRETTEDEQ